MDPWAALKTLKDAEGREETDEAEDSLVEWMRRGGAAPFPVCKVCGDHCTSQLEYTASNENEPWPHCSGCDPEMREDDAKWGGLDP